MTDEEFEIVDKIVDIMRPKAYRATGKDRTAFFVIQRLIDAKSDTEAVKQANYTAGHSDGWEKITVTEFRKWLPVMIGGLFRDYVETRAKET